MKTINRRTLQGWAVGAMSLGFAASVQAADLAENDGMNGTLWLQTSVEFKANALSTYRLAGLQLDAALADKSWTAVPGEQMGDYKAKPPAIILDVDETVLDNSVYQAWVVTQYKYYSGKTWGSFVYDVLSRPISRLS